MNTKSYISPLAVFMVSLLISGCINSSGVVPMGQDTYMIARTQWGFSDPAVIKGAEIKEADDFCKAHGKVLRVTKTIETPLKVGREPAAQVYFRALDPNDPELKKSPAIEEIIR